MSARVFTLDKLRTSIDQEVGVSEWFEITQEKIDRFAALTADPQWIHVDPERARAESQYGTTIAHGFFTLSLLSHLSHEAVEIAGDFKMRINYGLNRVRFVSPVPCGSRVRAHFAPKQVGENEVIWSVTMEREGAEKPALVADWIIRFY